MPDLTNALLNEWAKMTTETLQDFVESLPRRVEVRMQVPVGVMVYDGQTDLHFTQIVILIIHEKNKF